MFISVADVIHVRNVNVTGLKCTREWLEMYIFTVVLLFFSLRDEKPFISGKLLRSLWIVLSTFWKIDSVYFLRGHNREEDSAFGGKFAPGKESRSQSRRESMARRTRKAHVG